MDYKDLECPEARIYLLKYKKYHFSERIIFNFQNEINLKR